uniref:Uncharacterized protein n=1 Tax=Arundo donax TaxID=35708 RepID=A0A0A9BL71_ARUDO
MKKAIFNFCSLIAGSLLNQLLKSRGTLTARSLQLNDLNPYSCLPPVFCVISEMMDIGFITFL